VLPRGDYVDKVGATFFGLILVAGRLTLALGKSCHWFE
jgi:hypothetical protein